MKFKYPISLIKSDEGYAVSCPVLPGCWSQGRTEAEAIKNIRGAIADYLAAVKETMANMEIREVEVTV